MRSIKLFSALVLGDDSKYTEAIGQREKGGGVIEFEKFV